MQNLANFPGNYLVRGDMCPHGMTAQDEHGEGLVLKPTGWMTNSWFIAEEVGVRCDNLYKSIPGDRHRHVHLVSGKARACQVYPVSLCLRILRGLYRQLSDDRLILQRQIGTVCNEEITDNGEFTDNNWEGFEASWHGSEETFAATRPVCYDDISGAPLPEELVEAAVGEEMAEYHKHMVYEKVPIAQCLERTGKKPIGVRWVITNKGTMPTPIFGHD